MAQASVEVQGSVEQVSAQPNIFGRVGNWVRGHSDRLMAPVLVLSLAIGAVACGGGNEASVSTNNNNDDKSELPSGGACPDTWEIIQTNNAGHRIIAEGVPAIGLAETPEEARIAMSKVMDVLEPDPDILARIANGIIDEDVTPEALTDESGKCASALAEQIATRIETHLSLSTITPDEAPADAINSGVDANGRVVQAYTAGIGGNRTALRVDGPDKKTFWVMERCGNLVVESSDLPKGPTDEKPKKLKTDIENPGSHKQPGDGGDPEEGMDPENDSDNDGYGPGDTVATLPDNGGGTGGGDGETTATTGPPREEAPPTPVTTVAPQPTGTMPPKPTT